MSLGGREDKDTLWRRIRDDVGMKMATLPAGHVDFGKDADWKYKETTQPPAGAPVYFGWVLMEDDPNSHHEPRPLAAGWTVRWVRQGNRDGDAGRGLCTRRRGKSLQWHFKN